MQLELFDEEMIELPYALALAAVIAAEIDEAKRSIKPGGTLTRSLPTYEDGEARVSIFVTTTIKG